MHCIIAVLTLFICIYGGVCMGAEALARPSDRPEHVPNWWPVTGPLVTKPFNQDQCYLAYLKQNKITNIYRITTTTTTTTTTTITTTTTTTTTTISTAAVATTTTKQQKHQNKTKNTTKNKTTKNKKKTNPQQIKMHCIIAVLTLCICIWECMYGCRGSCPFLV